MLSPDRDLTARGRLRVFAVWQVPTLLFTAYLAVGLALTAPQLVQRPLTVASFVAVAAASVAAVAIPWERVGLTWRVLVPAVSLAAAVVLRLDLADVRSIGLLSVLPMMWLAFDFGRRGVALAVLGGCAQSVVPLVSEPGLSDGLAWVQASLFPIMAIAVAVVARSLSTILGNNHRALVESHAAVRTSLELARHRLVVVEKVMSVVDAGVCYLDDDGEPLLTNARALDLARIAGRHPDHMPEEARFAGLHVYADDRTTPVPAEEQVIHRARRGEEDSGRLQWYGPPGDQRAVVVSCHQLYDGAARLGAVAAAWDVTDLIEAVEVRDRFLATVSHELRTPLTSIIGHHDLLADADEIADDPLLARSLASARRNAHVLMTRIEELLESSRTQASPRATVDAVPTDLSDVVAEAVGRHRRPAANAGITLTPDLTDVTAPEAEQVWAPVDPARLGRALDQLLGNALKYTPSGGAVTVTLDREDHRDGSGTAVLAVADTGCGMTRAEARRAFDRFYRTDSARSSAIQGMGLGLSIARSLVEAHGGSIELDSTPGRGTVVMIRIPVPAPA